MESSLIVVASCLAIVAGCQQSGGRPGLAGNPASPTAAAAAASVERPWKASIDWKVTGVQWAGAPGTAKSLFDGRCSVMSDYVVSSAFGGEATHAGRITGEASHCTQITWTDRGPGAVAYTDGRGTLVAANGSSVVMRYGDGVTGLDEATGETWFEDRFQFTGGTGLFAGATGTGREGGRFKDFLAVLGGAPVPMWMEGTIVYGPGSKQQ